jgi:hypothetical protein
MQQGISKIISIILLCQASCHSAIASPAATPIDWDAQETELVVSSPVKTDLLPDQSDIAAVSGRFEEFFRLLAAGDLHAAYDMQTDHQKLQMSYEEWGTLVAQGLTASEDVVRRQFIRISWYPDSPASPVPGLNVALDYAFWGAAGDFQCGYIILSRSASGIYSVSRTDQTYVPAKYMVDLTPNDDLIQKLPCYLGVQATTAFPAPQ